MQILLKKAEINELNLYFKELEGQQNKPKESREQEIINIRAEINEIRTKILIEKRRKKDINNMLRIKRAHCYKPHGYLKNRKKIS